MDNTTPRFPLLYYVPIKDRKVIGALSPVPEKEYWVVQIVLWDYVSKRVAWQDNTLLGDVCLVPDTDICFEQHKFDTEKEAFDFMRKWWIERSQSELINNL